MLTRIYNSNESYKIVNMQQPEFKSKILYTLGYLSLTTLSSDKKFVINDKRFNLLNKLLKFDV